MGGSFQLLRWWQLRLRGALFGMEVRTDGLEYHVQCFPGYQNEQEGAQFCAYRVRALSSVPAAFNVLRV